MLSLAYIVFSLLGCAYIVFSVLSGHGDAGGAAGTAAHGGHAPDVHYGVDGHGHGSASADGSVPAAFHFPFFSPLALATLFAAVGAYGLIALHGFGASEGLSLGLAVPAAFATAYAITYVGYRVIAGSRSTSTIRLDQLVGSRAEVITPIPAGGVGEVAAIVAGERFSGPAREAAGGEVPRGALVKVQAMAGSTLIVSREPS
jgi:membrane protein implicated in regulation of membrane protease activity